MPFPADVDWYRAMADQADVISTAIESLDVQVHWEDTQVIGVTEREFELLEPLIEALADYGGLSGALRTFTKGIFCFGNVAVFVHPEGVKMWRPDWRLDADHRAAAASGRVLEAHRPPVDSQGYACPFLESGLEKFKQRWQAQNEAIRKLDEFTKNPVGAPPIRRHTEDLVELNSILQAIGFGPWDPKGDLPHLRNPQNVRSEMKLLFEQHILQPFAVLQGIRVTPTVAP